MSALKEHFNYRKFAQKPYRILFLNNDYFLQKQTIRILKQMGHRVLSLQVTDNPARMLECLLQSAVELKPDCIISMNHEGFDREGKIAAILEEFRIPVLIWYLDDFRFILPNYQAQVRENILIFTFEKANIPQLIELGFEGVEYLPTATILNPAVFYKNDLSEKNGAAFVFVGNSFETTKIRWYRENYIQYLRELQPVLTPEIYGEALLEIIRKNQRHYFSTEQDFYHYCGYVTAHVTQLYRQTMLNSFEDSQITIYGDTFWKQLLQGADLRSGIDPEQRAPAVYANAGINLNFSSAQLETAVNMRVFDIPASGGFLITDWRNSLAELFDEEKELVVFHQSGEAAELSVYYAGKPQKRDAIIRRARERVQREHRLEQRICEMLNKATSFFK